MAALSEITAPAPSSARARVRAELTREIMDAARAQLIERGAHELSLRAVARDLGMAPSGLYRYFAGRDELLTALIIDSYTSLGAATSAAAAAAAGEAPLDRWVATAGAIWRWAHAHPQEWALIYGSPVPGYRAPEDTIAAARLVVEDLLGVVSAAAADGRLAPAARAVADPAALGPALDGVRTLMGGVDDAHVAATVAGFAEIVGMITLHLFGHLEGGVDPAEVLWDQMVGDRAQLIGLRPDDPDHPDPDRRDLNHPHPDQRSAHDATQPAARRT